LDVLIFSSSPAAVIHKYPAYKTKHSATIPSNPKADFIILATIVRISVFDKPVSATGANPKSKLEVCACAKLLKTKKPVIKNSEKIKNKNNFLFRNFMVARL